MNTTPIILDSEFFLLLDWLLTKARVRVCTTILHTGRREEQIESSLSQRYLYEMKEKQPRLGSEVGTLSPPPHDDNRYTTHAYTYVYVYIDIRAYTCIIIIIIIIMSCR